MEALSVLQNFSFNPQNKSMRQVLLLASHFCSEEAILPSFCVVWLSLNLSNLTSDFCSWLLLQQELLDSKQFQFKTFLTLKKKKNIFFLARAEHSQKSESMSSDPVLFPVYQSLIITSVRTCFISIIFCDAQQEYLEKT